MQISTGVRRGGLLGLGIGLTGCLVALATIALIAACIGGILLVINRTFTSSDVYQEALATAQNDSRVQAALGTPIEAGWFVMGSMETQGLSGEASLTIPIHGPNGSGTIFASARRENGVWNFYTLAVQVEGQTELIVLQ